MACLIIISVAVLVCCLCSRRKRIQRAARARRAEQSEHAQPPSYTIMVDDQKLADGDVALGLPSYEEAMDVDTVKEVPPSYEEAVG